MPIATLRPDGTIFYNMQVLAGAGSVDAALRDDSDGSYVQANYGGYTCRVSFNSFTLPSGAVVKTLTPRLRARQTTLSGNAYVSYSLKIGETDIPGGTRPLSPNFTDVATTYTLAAVSGNRSQADIDALNLEVQSGNVLGPAYGPQLIEMAADVFYVAAPNTPVITAPSGTITATSPTVSWTHRGGADAETGQTFYRVRVLSAGTLVYDTGNVASAAASAVVGPLALGSYTAIVNTAQTTQGVVQFSPDASSAFTINVTPPVTTVTGPTGTVGTTRPTVTWTHTPSAGAQTGQTFYRVRAYATSDLTTALFDSGEVASAASSLVIGPLDSTKTSWRVVVNTAQTTSGVVQWSVDATRNFTLDVTPPLVSAVAVAPLNPTGALKISVTRNATGPAWSTLDIQWSIDGGVTWAPVRGWTAAPAFGDLAVATDYEAPNDVDVLYRARATRTVSGNVLTGPWVVSAAARWTNTTSEVWVKDPTNPARNLSVCVAALPEPLYDRQIGVFRPVGAYHPVVVSDMFQAPSGSVTVMTSSKGEYQALLLLLSATVVLVQAPDTAWGWGSRYIAPGAIQEARTGPTSKSAARLLAISFTEVDRPPDTGTA